MAKNSRVLPIISCIYYLPCRPTKQDNLFLVSEVWKIILCFKIKSFCPETSVTNYQSTLRKIPEKTKVSNTLRRKPDNKRGQIAFLFFHSRRTECIQIPSEVHSLHILHSTYFLVFHVFLPWSSLPIAIRLIHLNPELRPRVKNMSMPAVSDLHRSCIHISLYCCNNFLQRICIYVYFFRILKSHRLPAVTVGTS
jgi:hypothetical protein